MVLPPIPTRKQVEDLEARMLRLESMVVSLWDSHYRAVRLIAIMRGVPAASLVTEEAKARRELAEMGIDFPDCPTQHRACPYRLSLPVLTAPMRLPTPSHRKPTAQSLPPPRRLPDLSRRCPDLPDWSCLD